MSIVNSLLKVFLGDKSGKDLKKLTPIVDEINNHFNKLSSISNDQLRNKTIEFKKLISDETKELNDLLSDLNNKLSNIAFSPTDLPEPVVPATNKCGIFSKLTTMGFPAMS